MMMRVAIDTVVLAALVDTRDKWHSAAVMLRDALKAERAEVSTFDPVLAETISLLARRLSEQKRLDQFGGVLDKAIFWSLRSLSPGFRPKRRACTRRLWRLCAHTAASSTSTMH